MNSKLVLVQIIDGKDIVFLFGCDDGLNAEDDDNDI
jgi:hypothetical protein